MLFIGRLTWHIIIPRYISLIYTTSHRLAMKVFSISLLSVAQSAPPAATLLGTAQDLSSFSFYQRSSVGEFMTFFTKVSSRFVRASSAIHSRPTTTDRRRANPCEPAVVRRREQLQSPCLCHFRSNTRRARSCRYVHLSKHHPSNMSFFSFLFFYLTKNKNYSGDDHRSGIPSPTRILAPH